MEDQSKSQHLWKAFCTGEFSFPFSIFQLFISQEKLQKKSVNQFYYKDIIRFFKHQSIYGLIASVDAFTSEIAKENQTFINENRLAKFLENQTPEVENVVLNLFKPFDNVINFIDRVLDLINFLSNNLLSLSTLTSSDTSPSNSYIV